MQACIIMDEVAVLPTRGAYAYQGASVFRKGGPTMTDDYLYPLLLLGLAYMAAFGSLWLVRIRAEVWRRRAEAAALRAARG